MLFFPSDRKVTKSKFGREKREKTSNYFEISHTKEAEVRDTFQRGWERDIIIYFLKVQVLLQSY